MKSVTSATLLVAIAGLALASCPASAARSKPPAEPTYGPEADYPVLVGDPYVIGGVTYTPSDTLNYDAVGYAHAATEGSGISGAHHTLPLPCYVEVTSLDSGHTIVVRLDRRGPMNGKQLVELSPAAWAQLGLPAGADAPVRVRRVNPPETERAALRVGNRAPERMETPPGLRAALRRKLGLAMPGAPDEPPSTTLAGGPAPAPVRTLPPAPKPVVVTKPGPPPAPVPAPAPPKPVPPKPVPPAASHAEAKHLIVQVAAFSSQERAKKAAAVVGGEVEPAGKLWRVRIVVAGDDEARAALAKAKQSGYAGALILHHD